MVDNIVLNTGIGGDTLAAKDIGGVKHQRVLTTFEDGGNLDAFGRIRMSDPEVLFSNKLINSDKSPLLWDEALETGAGITGSTPTIAKPYIDFLSTASTAGLYTRQTHRRFNYQPGKGQLILITGVLKLSGGGTGVKRRLGYFDNDNGIFFEDNEGNVNATVRSNDTGTPIDIAVSQASWNIDVMNGSGDASNPSGITADWSKAQIFVIDFQWLSVGRVRFGLEIDGTIHYVHQFSRGNTSSIPWASTPNLPVRYQMVTSASSPVASMRVICCSVISEGQQNEPSLPHSEATIDHVNCSTADTWYALIGGRLKSTHLGVTIKVSGVSVLAETSDSFEWAVIINPIVAGTFTYADKTDSALQTVLGDIGGSNTVTGGTVVARGFATSSAGASVTKEYIVGMGALIDGTRDTMVLAVRPLGTNADIQGAANWTESI